MTGTRRRRARWTAPAVALAALATLAMGACSTARPVARPAADPGKTVYSVGALSFEAPASWSAEGDARKVRLAAPDGGATLEARAAAVAGPDEACLADAEKALARGAASLSGVRRHPSSFAGRKAVAQEADAAGWHGWAWAACAGGEQYRVWLAARTPVDRDRLEVQRRLVATARLEPSGDAPGSGRR
jgi:hypothetical protein